VLQKRSRFTRVRWERPDARAVFGRSYSRPLWQEPLLLVGLWASSSPTAVGVLNDTGEKTHASQGDCPAAGLNGKLSGRPANKQAEGNTAEVQ